MPPASRTHRVVCVLAGLLLALHTAAASQQTSRLWGSRGERFSVTERGRLQDWSWAGYKGGAQLPPGASTLPVTVDITQFGARPDGVGDATQAIKAAVASQACKAAAQCVVYLPPGKYSIKQQLVITAPVVLRGAGRDRTTLHFPYSLKEIKRDFSASNPWFTERLLEFVGTNDIIRSGPGATKLAAISRISRRGSPRVYVDTPRAFRKGQQVRIVASDYGEDGDPIGPNTTPLLYSLYGSIAQKVDTTRFGNRQHLVEVVARVKEVLADSIVLDRALPVSITPGWKDASVHTFAVTGAEGPVMGLEGVTVEFPETLYKGHFREDGYSGVGFRNTANCFTRNLRVKNSDWALDADSIYRCTFSDILIESDRTPDREGHHGHHGICLVRAIDTLITDFVIAAPYVHDLTLAGGATGNVFRNGRTADLALDYHRQLPWSNLLTNVHAGEGNRPWDSGGRTGRGPHAGPWNTVWNVQTDRGRALPLPCPKSVSDRQRYGCGAYGPLMTLVGANVQGRVPSDWWVENIPATQLVPQDLYTAQVKARLGRVLYTAPMPTMPRGSRRPGIREAAAPVRSPPTISRRSTATPSRTVVVRADRRSSAVASLMNLMLEEFAANRDFAETGNPWEDFD